MKFIKIKKQDNNTVINKLKDNVQLEVVDLEPNFEAFRKEIDCEMIELYKINKFLIILDEEGLFNNDEIINNLGMFSGDFLIGVDGVYDWDYSALEKPSKSEFLDLTDEDVKEVKKGFELIKSILYDGNQQKLISDEMNALYSKYKKHIKAKDKINYGDLVKELFSLNNEIHFDFKEIFFMELILRNY